MKKMPRMLYLGIFLLCLGLIAGGLLAVCNGITAPIIEANEKAKLEKTLSAINAKDPTKLDVSLVDGVVEVYSCTYEGEEGYVFNCSNSNKYTTVSMLIVIVDGKVVNANVSGTPSITTHGMDAGFDLSTMGVMNAVDATSYKSVSGATFSSQSVEKCLSAAFAQYAELAK